MSIEQRKQQMQDILKDTVDYYREDPSGRRCVTDDGDCMYTWGDRHCAIGRYMRPEFQSEEFSENNGATVNGLLYHIDHYLVKNVWGLDLDFWSCLQDLHDTVGYWEEWHEHKDGVRDYKLTDRGKEVYVAMQDRIARGDYDG